MSNNALLASKVREKMAWYICQWIGTPGGWGGDDFSAYDCNGVIHETLQGVGLEERGFDCTANDLYLKYPIECHVPDGYTGCLVFWFSGRKAIHVEMMIDRHSVVGASGTGRPRFDIEDWLEIPFLKTIYKLLKPNMQVVFTRILKGILYRDQAIQSNAYVKMNDLGYRGNNYKIIDPTKGEG